MSRKLKKICYRCGEKATTNEHVPPRSIFPEKKDVGKDYRVNLIKVPSCDAHNSGKSNDDEFLMVCLGSSVKVNSTGYLHFRTKVTKAVRRKHPGFIHSISKNPEEYYYRAENGDVFPLLLGGMHHERMHECFENIAYGFYYFEFRQIFNGEIKTTNNLGIPKEHNTRSFLRLVDLAFENDKRKLMLKGQNPEIFTYQFTSPDEFGIISLRLIFYGYIKVFIALIPNGSKRPFEIGNFLFSKGFDVTYDFDGEEVKFIGENENQEDESS